MKWDHRTHDRANAESDRLIARRLRRDSSLHRQARANLRRWIRNEEGKVAPVLLEWAEILEILTRQQLADFLELGTAKARRLRQSSPFMGLLNKREQRIIDAIYDEETA